MRLIMLAFFATTLALAAQTPPTVAPPAVVNDPFPPAHISDLYIEKDDFRGNATSVQLSGDALTYKVTDGSKVIESTVVHPTDDDWFKFIQALNTAKVYNWAPKYEFPGQGATWVVDFTMDDRRFTSGGTNDYPKEGDESQPAANPASGPSVPFQLFWQAVLTLVGKGSAVAPSPMPSK